jgi:hypothetical protein
MVYTAFFIEFAFVCFFISDFLRILIFRLFGLLQRAC